MTPRKRQRAEVIDGRVELEYQARITAVRKVIHETVSAGFQLLFVKM